MAEFVGKTSLAKTTSGTLELTPDAGTMDGDVMFAFIVVRGPDVTENPITPPDGWDELDFIFESGSPSLNVGVYQRTADDEGSEYAWAFGSENESCGSLVTYGDIDPDAPVLVHAIGGQASGSTTRTTPAVAIAEDGCVVVSYFADRSGSTWVGPDEERAEVKVPATSASLLVCDSGDDEIPTGETTRTATASASTSVAVQGIIVLSPAPPPAPPPARFPLPDTYELLLDGTWTDITGYVYDRDEVAITRGRSAEAQEADPSKMTLTLNNRDGRFSPRNPSSPYYGILGRNTRIRASLPAPAGYLRLEAGATQSHMSCPSAAALAVTDLDVRIDLDVDDWGDGNVCGKYDVDGDDCSWFLDFFGNQLFLVWSPTGADADRIEAGATVGIPSASRLALRVTLDVDNGSGGYEVKFYTSDSIEGTWTQLGDTVTGSGTTSIASSSADLEVGALSTIEGSGPDGRLWAFELYDGIDGTLVAGPDLDAQTPGDNEFTDEQDNVWTVGAGAQLDDRDYRFHGEVATWPTTYSMNGVDHYVQITAAGIKRRLTQNAPPARSPMFREFASPARTHIQAYWPMEDGQEATQIAAAGSGVAPMKIEGAPTLASYSGWTASDPLPVMASGRLTGVVPSYFSTGEISIRLFVFVDENPAAETSLLHVSTTGSAKEWDVRLTSSGGLRTRAWGPDGASLLDSTAAFAMASRGFTILDLELSEDGSDVDWRTLVIDFNNTQTRDASFTQVSDSGTVSGQTAGAARVVTVGRDQGLTNVVVGHLTVAEDLTAYAGTTAAIAAQNGENPTDRMERLCDEEEVAFVSVSHGARGNFVLLGDQLNRTHVELLQEAADTDLGILYEPRRELGFAYRSRASMYNQDPGLTLDYSAAQVTGDLVPVDDDRATLNDLRVEREGGSSVHVEQTTGPLSTAAPPDGVGRYPGQVTVTLSTDAQLADHAGWRLHLGTVDEPRVPTLEVNLRAPGISDDLYDQVMALDIGDRIVLTGIPEGLPRDDVSLLVQGYSESLRLTAHVVVFNLTPESPWHVGQIETDGFDRIDTDGSTLAAAATSTATSLSVASTGALWTTSSDDLPFDIFAGGERMTVTAISGTTSPQTFTVTRSVNHIVKAQASGTAVRIVDPVFVAL